MKRFLIILILVVSSTLASAEKAYYWSVQNGQLVVSDTQTSVGVYWRPLGVGTSSSTQQFTPSATVGSMIVSYYLFTTNTGQTQYSWGMGASSDGYGYVEAANGLRLGKGKIKVTSGKFEFVPDQQTAAQSIVFCQYPMRSIAGTAIYVTGVFPGALISNSVIKVPVGLGWSSVVTGTSQQSAPSSTLVPSGSYNVYLTAVKIPYATAYVMEKDPNNPNVLILKTVQKNTIMPIYTSQSAFTIDGNNMRTYLVGKGSIRATGVTSSFVGSASNPKRYYYDYIKLYRGVSTTWLTAVASDNFSFTDCPYPCDLGTGYMSTNSLSVNFLPASTQAKQSVYQGQFGIVGSRFMGYSLRQLVSGSPYPTNVGSGFISISNGVMAFSATRPVSAPN